MQKNIIVPIIAVILAGGLAFWGGIFYGKNQASLLQSQRFSQFGQRTGNGAMPRTAGGFSSGSIIAKDDTSITVQMQDNSSKIVLYSASTQVGQFVSGLTGDLKVGQTVMVTGQTNSDGSITAQSIQIRPAQAE